MYDFNNQSLSDEEMYFWLCQMARQLDSAIVIINSKKGYTIDFVNHVFIRMTEYSEADMTGSTLAALHGPLTDMLNEEAIHESIVNGLTYKTSSFHYRKDGSTFWNEVNHLPMRNQNGELQYSVILMKDVTESVNTEALIELERDVYYSLENGDTLEKALWNICNNVEMTYGIGCKGSIMFFDDEYCIRHFYGRFSKELNAIDERKIFTEVFTETGNVLKKPIVVKNIQQSKCSKAYKKLAAQNNFHSFWTQPILNNEGKVIGLFLLTFNEEKVPQAVDFKLLNRVVPIIALAVNYFEQKNKIRQLAYHDVSTGLSNFEKFKTTMMNLIEHGCEGFVYIIEPGEYQKIIELYGRQGGDGILRQIACRLQNIPTYDDAIMGRYTNSALIIASRQGGDSLDLSQLDIDELLFEPYYIDDQEVYVTLKIGTAAFSKSAPFAQAIRQADTALSNALKSTGTVIKLFEDGQLEAVEQEMKVLSHISKGLKNKEFFPVLQPKINLATGEIESFEALARWISADIGFVSPAQFIPVAEDTGNIYKIDREIFKKVLQWQKQRLAANLSLYQVSVNISPSHFYNPAFIESSVQLIEHYGIDPNYIKFEITESVELENVMRAKKIINELNDYGIATSIDDFGVGYSSLGYLQDLPFEEIKIDKSFVDNIEDPRMNAVIKTIIQLSQNLNMVSVAEGIETEEQHLELKRLGCNSGQGYYYYKPMPLDEIDKLLDTVHSN